MPIKSFYLASGFSSRDMAKTAASQIILGAQWFCTSRWLFSSIEWNLAKAAKIDIEDVDRADYFIMLSHRSSTGGKWFEAGYAYARMKPFVHIGMPLSLDESGFLDGNCCFLHLPRVEQFPSIEAFLQHIQSRKET